jgi:hypothetical protein
VQGIGAAILAPSTLALLQTSFPEGPERTRAAYVGLDGDRTGAELVGQRLDAVGPIPEDAPVMTATRPMF